MDILYDMRFTNLKGDFVERNKITHPYSYDEYCLWKSPNFNINKCSNLYSDRLMNLDYDKFRYLCKETFGDTGQYFTNRNPKDINQFLNSFLGYKVELVAITECCNISNGYPYWCFYISK